MSSLGKMCDMQSDRGIALGNTMNKQTLGDTLDYGEKVVYHTMVPAGGCDWLTVPGAFDRSVWVTSLLRQIREELQLDHGRLFCFCLIDVKAACENESHF